MIGVSIPVCIVRRSITFAGSSRAIYNDTSDHVSVHTTGPRDDCPVGRGSALAARRIASRQSPKTVAAAAAPAAVSNGTGPPHRDGYPVSVGTRHFGPPSCRAKYRAVRAILLRLQRVLGGTARRAAEGRRDAAIQQLVGLFFSVPRARTTATGGLAGVFQDRQRPRPSAARLARSATAVFAWSAANSWRSAPREFADTMGESQRERPRFLNVVAEKLEAAAAGSSLPFSSSPSSLQSSSTRPRQRQTRRWIFWLRTRSALGGKPHRLRTRYIKKRKMKRITVALHYQ